MPPPYRWKLENYDTECFIRKNSDEYVLNLDNVKFEKRWLLCHLLGQVLATYWKQKETCTLENASYICLNQPDWELVKNLYKHSYVKPKKIICRWKNMNDERYHFLIWVKCFLSKQVSIKDFITGLYSFKCIQLYILDMQWYQFAMHWVYQELFEHVEIKLTKEWDASVVVARILHDIFNIDTIQVGQDYNKLNLDGYIYDRICNGLTKMPLENNTHIV